MIDLLDLANSSGHGATLSNPLPRMNPFGLRPAYVLGARSGRTCRIKTPPVPLSERPIQPRRSNSTRDCGGILVYVKFMHLAAKFTRVQCNMNLFSSSRKVF